MACGTPVVAFRVGGVPEAAPEGHGAILCETQSATALIEAIVKVRGSPELRDSLRNAGRQIVVTRNGLTPFAQAFRRLYEECVRPAKMFSVAQSAFVT
jgi:glycosyltransferase involved in cell wall biosynthesis